MATTFSPSSVLKQKVFVEADISTWSEADYRARLAEVGSLMNIPDDDPRSDRLVMLAELVSNYEEIHYPLPAPSPESRELYQREMRGEAVDWDSLPATVLPPRPGETQEQSE